MKIVRNKYIPFGKFDAMNILGILFVKEGVELKDDIINHEAIHTAQQYEIMTASALVALLISNIFSTWWYLLIAIAMPILLYVLAWLIEVSLPPYTSAYWDSPFEREAHLNRHNPMYLATRTFFAWTGYILKKRK